MPTLPALQVKRINNTTTDWLHIVLASDYYYCSQPASQPAKSGTSNLDVLLIVCACHGKLVAMDIQLKGRMMYI